MRRSSGVIFGWSLEEGKMMPNKLKMPSHHVTNMHSIDSNVVSYVLPVSDLAPTALKVQTFERIEVVRKTRGCSRRPHI